MIPFVIHLRKIMKDDGAPLNMTPKLQNYSYFLFIYLLIMPVFLQETTYFGSHKVSKYNKLHYYINKMVANKSEYIYKLKYVININTHMILYVFIYFF